MDAVASTRVCISCIWPEICRLYRSFWPRRCWISWFHWPCSDQAFEVYSEHRVPSSLQPLRIIISLWSIDACWRAREKRQDHFATTFRERYQFESSHIHCFSNTNSVCEHEYIKEFIFVEKNMQRYRSATKSFWISSVFWLCCRVNLLLGKCAGVFYRGPTKHVSLAGKCPGSTT